MSSGSEGVFTCVTCGKEYHMCRKCAHTKIPYVAWRATACSPSCYEVSETINAHYYGRIDSAEAAKRLKDAEWKKIEHMLPDVREYVEKVMKETASRNNKTAKLESGDKSATE